MQSVGTCTAEDSCFIKNPSSNDGGSVALDPSRDVDRDVEKAGIGAVGDSAVANPLSEAEKAATTNENQVFGSQENKNENQGADPDISAATGQDDKNDFPEGGVKSWSVVVGAFCGLFSVFGIINSTAVLLQYMQENQLKDYSPGEIGWIFGLSLFLTFFCGAPIGPIFDAYGPKLLMFCGSILLIASMFLLGLCTKYWHFMVVYSVLNGIGGSLINTPCIASVGHFFLVRRGNATGIAMTAGSIGGIIFPLMLQKLFPSIGFAWATRCVGFILVFLLVIANILVDSRLPRKKIGSFKKVCPDLTVFKDMPFALITLGIFFMEWGIFVPLTYITSYVIAHGHTTAFGFQILAIANAGSFFGRFFAGMVADLIGRINTLTLTLGMCAVACLALWLPASNSTAMIVVFSVIFGCVSGSNLSLSPVCVGQMCKTEHYGRYFATCWMFVAFGTLTGLPIAGQILTVNGGNYNGLIIFAGLSYVLSTLCLIAARVIRVGWKLNVVY